MEDMCYYGLTIDRKAGEDIMQYADIIQESLDYIEDNLKTDITAGELADMAGFSVFHFSHLFSRAVGLPVRQYIVRRRLLWAAWEMARGTKQIDAAYAYGFSTAAGFYKAFRREFGCSPSEYAKDFCARKPYRIHLTKEESIMISNAKLREVLRNWDLSDNTIQTMVQTQDGNVRENTCYVGQNHVLKLFSSAVSAKANADVMTAMEAAGLSCGAPVKTKAGESVYSDGELYFLLTRRIHGSELDPDALFGAEGQEHARYLGRILGQLHTALAACPDLVCNERDIYREVCDCWLAPAAQAMGLPERFSEEYRSFGPLHDSLPVQIIHRDPNPSNILMQEGRLAGFIDFDLTQRSIRLFDPCYAATAVLCGLFQKGQQDRLDAWLDVFREILRGYDGVAQLTPEEKQAIPMVVLSIQLICVGWFSAYDKYHSLAKTNMDMLRWLQKHREQLTL